MAPPVAVAGAALGGQRRRDIVQGAAAEAGDSQEPFEGPFTLGDGSVREVAAQDVLRARLHLQGGEDLLRRRGGSVGDFGRQGARSSGRRHVVHSLQVRG